MKKFLVTAIILAWTTMCFAASSQTVTKPDCGIDCRSIKITYAAENGAYTAYALTAEEMDYIKGWWLCMFITNPGATAPDDNWDMYLKTSDVADLLGGGGENRDTSNSEIGYPIVDSTSGQRACVPVVDSLTFSMANIDSGLTKEVDGVAWFFFYRSGGK